MNLRAIIVIILSVLCYSCKKESIKSVIADPCAQMVKGYVVGFDQCYMTKGFVVSTISPTDTFVTYNLPDSLYHFPKNASDNIYRNYNSDFLFPASYKNKFPINYSFEIVPENDMMHVICLDQYTGHFYRVVKKEVKITCATK